MHKNKMHSQIPSRALEVKLSTHAILEPWKTWASEEEPMRPAPVPRPRLAESTDSGDIWTSSSCSKCCGCVAAAVHPSCHPVSLKKLGIEFLLLVGQPGKHSYHCSGNTACTWRSVTMFPMTLLSGFQVASGWGPCMASAQPYTAHAESWKLISRRARAMAISNNKSSCETCRPLHS